MKNAQIKTQKIKGIETFFVQIGEGNRDIVMLHGWGGNWESFWDMAQILVAANPDFRVFIPDLPGFGRSANPDTGGWSSHDYEIWLESFLTTQQITDPHFVVHSFGGRVVGRFLVKNPHYAPECVFIATAGIRWPFSSRQKISVFCAKTFKKAKRFIPLKIQKFMMNRVFGARDWGCVDENVRPTLRKVLNEPDFRAELKHIETEILLLWGGLDTITPLKSGKAFHDALPNSKLKIYPDGRHAIHRTHVDQTSTEVLAWLG